jgi:hypothetical protein
MAQRLTRFTCAGGVPNFGEHDCAFPVAGVLGSSSGKLHGLLGNLSRGLDRAEEGRKWFGHGGCLWAALAGRGEVAGAMGELRGVWRGAEDATGKTAGLWGGLYSRGAGMVTGGRGRGGGGGGLTPGRAMSPPPRFPPRARAPGAGGGPAPPARTGVL